LAFTPDLTDQKGIAMKVVVVGGTGLIGSKVVARLQKQGHEAVAAAPNTGVNTLTGEGLDAALTGASTVVDVSNSPSFEPAEVMEFFQTSTRHLQSADPKAGARHHVALSVVGTERLTESGYFRAKIAQEQLIEKAPIPYSLVHATQFFEFINAIAQAATVGDTVRLPPVKFQPIAADEVANAVSEVSLKAPLNGRLEIAGPEQFRFDEVVRDVLSAEQDPREVVADEHATYFGAELRDDSLVPTGGSPRPGKIRLQEWLSRS
jgi:uncharacterized protein YbjT (DUF2867 family)